MLALYALMKVETTSIFSASYNEVTVNNVVTLFDFRERYENHCQCSHDEELLKVGTDIFDVWKE